jgi:hypothetical protein
VHPVGFIIKKPICLHNYLKDIKPVKNMETVSDILSKYIWNYERFAWQEITPRKILEVRKSIVFRQIYNVL